MALPPPSAIPSPEEQNITVSTAGLDPEYSVAIDSDRRTYAPGEDVWVTVQLITRPPVTPTKKKFKVGGSVVLSGEERVSVLDSLAGTVQIFKPVVVFLEGSTQIQRWRVRLQLPDDVPPSCELGAIAPCGLVSYVITSRVQISQGPLITSAKRIRVVSSNILADARAADVPGVMLQPSSFFSLWCARCIKPDDEPAPELRVTLQNSQSSFRPGEHIKYRVLLRGSAAKGGATKMPRIDSLNVSIWRVRWFSDSRGREATVNEIVKPPQTVDFSGSAAGILPVDFQGSVCVPLGIAPTVRSILLSNDYDLVVKVYIGRGEVGSIQVPITVFRDVEGNFLSPAFSPQKLFAGSHRASSVDVHNGIVVGDGEEEEMEELALT
jgi:hypothetical protein